MWLAGYWQSSVFLLFMNRDKREFEHHVYGKRQTSDSSRESLKIENKEIKTARNNSYVQKIA